MDPNDRHSLEMITFYEILHSLQFTLEDGGVWEKFENADDPGQAKKAKESYHLVKFDLETGKKHQIRLASSYALGAPILGDFKHNYDSQTCSKDLLRRSFKYTKL